MGSLLAEMSSSHYLGKLLRRGIALGATERDWRCDVACVRPMADGRLRDWTVRVQSPYDPVAILLEGSGRRSVLPEEGKGNARQIEGGGGVPFLSLGRVRIRMSSR